MPSVTDSPTRRRSSASSVSKISSTYSSSPKKRELSTNRVQKAAYILVKNSLESPLESRQEFVAVLQHAGRNPTGNFVQKYWTPETEEISFEDFCRILKDEPENDEEDLRKAFRKIDKNGDNVISYQELKHILLQKGEQLTEEEISEIFELADLNSDGKIDYKEFVLMVQKTASETREAALRRLDRLEKSKRQEKAARRRERTKEHRESAPLVNGQNHPNPQNGIHESPGHSGSSNRRNSNSVLNSNIGNLSLKLPPPNSEYRPGPDKKKLKGCFHTRCFLDPGEYVILPFTTGCRFRPRVEILDEKSKSDLVQSDQSGKVQLTKQFKMVLMNVFDLFDLDDSGGLNREEFNLYNVRTGDEHVTDGEWEVVKQNFDTKSGELTMKGFIQLHQMEAEDGEGDTDDMWVSLQAVGYNYKLQMDEVCPYMVEIYAEDSPLAIKVEGIQTISTSPEWNSVLQYLSENSKAVHNDHQLSIGAFTSPFWAILIFNHHSSKHNRSNWKVEEKSGENLAWAFPLSQIPEMLKEKNLVILPLVPRDESEEISFCLKCTH